MREPYRTLLEPFFDHELLGPYLQDREPDWLGLATDEKVGLCSDGEKIMLRIAHAFAGRDRSVLVADLGRLDTGLRVRVAEAILISCRDEPW